MPTYHFYLQKTDASGTASATAADKKDLETDFSGLKYISCTGLENVGKPKNIYTENYAEADGLRVLHPKDAQDGVVYHESTSVELTVIITGDNRRDVYTSLRNFIESGRLFYWDTARNKKVWLVFSEATEPTEDIIKGGLKYIRVSFKFTNLWGIGKKCNDSGEISA